MDNNSESLGTDLEGTVAPQTTNEPAPLVYDREANYVVRNFDTGELSEMTAYAVSRELENAKTYTNRYFKLRSQIGDVETLLKTALTEVSDPEWIDFIKEIAEALDITLTRTYSVTVTATHTFNVEVELGGDEPEESDFTPEISSWLFRDLEDLDSEITDFEANED